MLFFLCYVNFYHGNLPTLAAFLAAIGVTVPAMAVARREAKATNSAVSEATGVHDQASAPRWRPEEYLAWCRVNDVQPYPQGRPPGGIGANPALAGWLPALGPDPSAPRRGTAAQALHSHRHHATRSPKKAAKHAAPTS